MRIYVGNLPYTTTEDELRHAFEAHGTVEEVQIPQEYGLGRHKGFAFIDMRSDDEGHKAIAALDGTDLKGRPLRCSRAFDRPRRAQ